MQTLSVAVLLLTLLATKAFAQSTIRAPGASETLAIVTHVDVLPDHASQTRDALSTYIQATRSEPGALHAEAMQEIRQNHFDVVEAWRDEATYRAHEASPATLTLRRTIGPWLGSPLDERIGTPLR